LNDILEKTHFSYRTVLTARCSLRQQLQISSENVTIFGSNLQVEISSGIFCKFMNIDIHVIHNLFFKGCKPFVDQCWFKYFWFSLWTLGTCNRYYLEKVAVMCTSKGIPLIAPLQIIGSQEHKFRHRFGTSQIKNNNNK
jgi:hypothetical protein